MEYLLDYSVLPPDLLLQSVVFPHDRTWRAAEALTVIDHLLKTKQLIFGVELMQNADGNPTWIRDSHYKGSISSAPEELAKGAKEFVLEFKDYDGALFNFIGSPGRSIEEAR
jgi:hypothetical protein